MYFLACVRGTVQKDLIVSAWHETMYFAALIEEPGLWTLHAPLTQRMTFQGVPGAINSNDYATHRASYRLAKVLVMRLRGSACFDFEYYRSRSRDLSSWPHAQLWDHFVQDGQFEGRSFR